jgi:hypothetical protein
MLPLRPRFTKWTCPLRFLHPNPVCFFLFPMLATYPVHLIALQLNVLIVLVIGEATTLKRAKEAQKKKKNEKKKKRKKIYLTAIG